MNFLRSLNFKRSTAIGWYLLIIAGSSVPGKSIPKFFTLTPDKLIHCAEYFGLGFLLIRWFAAEFTMISFKRLALVTLGVGAMCGMIDELYQNLTPNRTPDFYDWCLDFVGVIIGIAFFFFLQRKKAWSLDYWTLVPRSLSKKSLLFVIEQTTYEIIKIMLFHWLDFHCF